MENELLGFDNVQSREFCPEDRPIAVENYLRRTHPAEFPVHSDSIQRFSAAKKLFTISSIWRIDFFPFLFIFDQLPKPAGASIL